jgi:hypothetical protein
LVQRGRCCRETTIRNCFALCDDWKYTARTCTHIIACMITLRVCLRRLNLHGKEMCFSGIRSTDWRSTVNLIHLIQWLTKAALIQTRFFCPINWVAPIKLCTTTSIQYPIDSCHVTSKQFLPTPCRPFPWNYPRASTEGWRDECSRAWKDTGELWHHQLLLLEHHAGKKIFGTVESSESRPLVPHYCGSVVHARIIGVPCYGKSCNK